MKAVLYLTKISEQDKAKRVEHMIGEKLLELGLLELYGKELRFEPREKGTHGKPFFTREPGIHYNISHSGLYVGCIFAEQGVGLDIQEHKKVSYDKVLKRMMEEEEAKKILESEHTIEEFFDQWALREAYIKWTGEGLSKNLRTISMNAGWHQNLSIEEGYSAAVWLAIPHEIEIRMRQVEIEE